MSGIPKAAAPVPPTQGNWYLVATSSSLPGSNGGLITNYSGPLAVSSNTVTITTLGNDSCFPNTTPLVLSGPSSSSSISLSSPQSSLSGFTLTITGKVNNGTNIDGTYQMAGSTNSKSCQADVGTVNGAAVPQLNGSWTGTVTENEYPSGGLNGTAPDGYVPNVANVTVTTTQGTTAATFGSAVNGVFSAFPLSGSVAFTNSDCYGSGTIDPKQSYILGKVVNIAVINAAGGYPTYFLSPAYGQPSSPLPAFQVFLSPVGGPCDQWSVSGTLAAAQ